MLVFDIETGPLPDDQLVAICPSFEPPPHPGEFDPASVKYGNLKDEAKRLEKLEQARTAHSQAIAEYGITVEAARTAHWAEAIEKAALSPLTGQVVAIGYYNTEKQATRVSGVGEVAVGCTSPFDEASILDEFWRTYEKCKAKNVVLGGWNIGGFDIPFLIRRSWLHSVDIPAGIFDRSGRYLDSTFVDLMQRFSAGKWGDNVKLETAAKFFGLNGKNGHGKDFVKLWLAGGEERDQARAYLTNDLAMTAGIAIRMGLG